LSQPPRPGRKASGPATARFRLDLEYEGTRYSGWQIQDNARTVQGELMAAITEACGQAPVEFMGAGRTDAGVHALCQTAHLEIATPMRPERLRHAINDRLPADIHVLHVERAAPSFHARHDAHARSYLYHVSRRRTAFGKRFVWWVKDPLDLAAMQGCAAGFVGLHDFRSFTADRGPNTRVKLERLDIVEQGDLLVIRVHASHFLWKMVRQLVGTLVAVGRGRLRPAEAVGFLRVPSPLPAEWTAPPSGLFLERAYYGRDEQSEPVASVLSVRGERH
jgi:tRNA pseudouridine38-40 synthase